MNLIFFFQNVVVTSEANTNGIVNSRVTKPLVDALPIFVNFVWVVLILLGLLTAYRIYSNWNNGNEENTTQQISRWFLGMVLSLCLIYGLDKFLERNPVSDSGNTYSMPMPK